MSPVIRFQWIALVVILAVLVMLWFAAGPILAEYASRVIVEARP